jgi:hypothetical protein
VGQQPSSPASRRAAAAAREARADEIRGCRRQRRRRRAAAAERRAAAAATAERAAREQEARAAEERRVEERTAAAVAGRVRALEGRERRVRGAAARLAGGDLALESDLTCMACLGLMRGPITLVPCGHSLCGGCAGGGACPECGPGARVEGAVACAALDAACGKYALRAAELAALQRDLLAPA